MEQLRDRGVYYSLYGDALLRKALERLTARLTGREPAVEEESEDGEAVVEGEEPEIVEDGASAGSVEAENGEVPPERADAEQDTTASDEEAEPE